MKLNKLFIAVMFLTVFGLLFFRMNTGHYSENGLNECTEYMRYVENENEYRKIIDWADREVFALNLRESDFISGNFSGPGKRYYTIDLNKVGVKTPDWLSGYEIRVLGARPPEFSALFIGGGKYRGLVIARGEWVRSVGNDIVPAKEIKLRRDRVGIVCYVEKPESP